MMKMLNDKDYRDPECETKTICDLCGSAIDGEYYHNDGQDAHVNCIGELFLAKLEMGEYIDGFEEVGVEFMYTFERALFINEYTKDCLIAE